MNLLGSLYLHGKPKKPETHSFWIYATRCMIAATVLHFGGFW